MLLLYTWHLARTSTSTFGLVAMHYHGTRYQVLRSTYFEVLFTTNDRSVILALVKSVGSLLLPICVVFVVVEQLGCGGLGEARAP